MLKLTTIFRIKQAFTLVETLVVIAIIAVLSSIILVGTNNAIQSGNLAKTQMFSVSLLNTLSENVISEWKFDEASGTTAYDTWNGNAGALTDFNFDSTDGWQPESKCISGGCLLFDGANDYVSVPHTENLQPGSITIEAWVKMNVNSAMIVSKCVSNGAANNPYDFRTDGNVPASLVLVRANATVFELKTSTKTFNINTWTHVVVTVDSSGNYVFYINGIDAGSGAFTSVITPTGNTNPMLIGKRDDGIFWNGYIDTVRIYSAAIPASRIREHYYAGLNNLLAKKEILKNDYQDKLTLLNKSFSLK